MDENSQRTPFERVSDRVPDFITDLVKSRDLDKAKWLDWESDFEGTTGYIDGIRPDFFKKNKCSALVGIDEHNRVFISFLTTGNGVLTFFQRYTDSERSWVNSTWNIPNDYIQAGSAWFWDQEIKMKYQNFLSNTPVK